MNLSNLPFKCIFVFDFEYRAPPSEKPIPVCLVSHEIFSGETKKVWLFGEDNPLPPYLIDESSLFIGHLSSAELGCHLVLGWEMPSHIVDTYVEFRCLTNCTDKTQPAAGLIDACTYFGIETISKEEKESTRSLILENSSYTEDEKEKIMRYCESDVIETSKLLRQIVMQPSFDLSCALLRGEFMKPVALMENRGIPIDVGLLELISSNWDEIRLSLIKDLDEFHIYEGVTFRMKNFTKLVSEKGWAWPTTENGNLMRDKDTMKEMANLHPEIEPLKDLMNLIGGLNIKSVKAGSDNRSRTMLSPFSTKTSRNAPKDSEDRRKKSQTKVRFMFGLPASLRSLVKPEKGKVLAIIDYEQQEFLIAAVLSNDKNMKDAYYSGDPYISLAILAGEVPPNATKKSHPKDREIFKQLVLAVQYGAGAELIASRIGKQKPYGVKFLKLHKRVFPKYWQWSDNLFQQASLHGNVIRTCYNWRMKLSDPSRKAKSTVGNFPIQATGAEILRVACIKLMENNIKIISPIHDAIAIECDEENADKEIKLAEQLMIEASQEVFDSGDKLRVESDIIRYPDRYISDKDRKKVWFRIINILEDIFEQKVTKKSLSFIYGGN